MYLAAFPEIVDARCVGHGDPGAGRTDQQEVLAEPGFTKQGSFDAAVAIEKLLRGAKWSLCSSFELSSDGSGCQLFCAAIFRRSATTSRPLHFVGLQSEVLTMTWPPGRTGGSDLPT